MRFEELENSAAECYCSIHLKCVKDCDSECDCDNSTLPVFHFGKELLVLKLNAKNISGPKKGFSCFTQYYSFPFVYVKKCGQVAKFTKIQLFQLNV